MRLVDYVVVHELTTFVIGATGASGNWGSAERKIGHPMSFKPIELGPFVLDRVRLKVVRKPRISDGEEALEFLWALPCCSFAVTPRM